MGLLAGLGGCFPGEKQSAAPFPGPDPHSYARPSEARVGHLHLALKVDFAQEKLQGTAYLQISHAAGAPSLMLDTKQLHIEEVATGADSSELKAVGYHLALPDSHLGQALIIPLEPETRWVRVRYETQPGAEALQFLPPALTATGEHPFLLTQSQAINARTWVPIQDSPGIRFTYSARIEVPPGLLAVMSAENPQAINAQGVYTFRMDQPVPAYLLALAVGKLTFRELGPRAGVYAEPPVIEAAAYEFAEIDSMMTLAEELYGPYRWERYDMIVLPPSFPFGGMENPRLTFLTPTLLAGDRSLVSTVAHELAHSWSGNLVTNATWDDFWLNEGFTVYFEMRIMEALKGREYSEMLAGISYRDLQGELAQLGDSSADTHLKLDLAGRNPDDGMTSIAYEKGYHLLRLIEETVGREAFDQFLSGYFDRHAFETMTTEAFVAELQDSLLSRHAGAAEAIDLEAWVYGPGLPENVSPSQSPRFAAVEVVRQQWQAGDLAASALPGQDWSTHEWLHFIHSLPDSLPASRLAELDATFALSASRNAEIQCAWYTQAVRSGYEAAYDEMRAFLTMVGRRKFLMPLYRTMQDTGQKTLAMDIYAEARRTYHPIAQLSLDELLGYKVPVQAP